MSRFSAAHKIGFNGKTLPNIRKKEMCSVRLCYYFFINY